MRLAVRIFFVILSFNLAAAAWGADNGQDISGAGQETTGCIPVRSLKEKDLAYKAGEVLNFTLHYKWGAINSDVGTASVRLDSVMLNGRRTFICDAAGRTKPFFDWFFKVRERFVSWFSMDGIQPQRFIRNSHEGHYHATNDYVYVWDASEPYIDADVMTSSSGERYARLPLDRCTYDLPALFYLARNMDFDKVEPGKKHPMTFAIDDEVFNVYFILKGREVINVKGIGKVRAVRFAARLLEGEVFGSDTDMDIWVTDDDNRVPLLFEAPLRVGVARGRLSEYSGLKHPFTSKL